MNKSAGTTSMRNRVLASAMAAVAMVALVLAQSGTTAKSEPASGKASANKYIGADKCKNCHQSEASGNPYGVWQKAAHSKAFENLASDKAKEIAKQKGIEDPQKSDQCLRCHTTAFGAAAEMIKKGFDAKLGVQCESCHGPGEAHLKARFAAAAKGGGDEGFGGDAQGKAAWQEIPAGEIITGIDQKTCLACHNQESPTFKPFCFYERAAKFAHTDPRKPDAAEERLVCGCEKCECAHGCEEGKCGVPEKKK
jgi:hypothetical protein